MGEEVVSARAWRYARLLVWAVSLTPPAEHDRAFSELDTTVFGPAIGSARTVRTPRRANERPRTGTVDPTAALRAARTVLECDAILDAAPVDWPALARAHGREPFGRTQRRALIARRDCPDDMTTALLTPWDPPVANRLVLREVRPLQWAWWPALQRMGEARPSLWRHVLTGQNLPAVLRAATRIDLLVFAVNGYDHNNYRKSRTFWDAVGAMLRAELGADREAWLKVAQRLTGHRGSLQSLIDKLGRVTAGTEQRLPDLRVLCQAPPEVLVDTVAQLTDEDLARAFECSFADVRSQEDIGHQQSLRSILLERLRQAGVPGREVFTRWAHRYSSTTVSAWLYGVNEKLDTGLTERAHTDVELRRLISARLHPRRLTTDLVTELRGCSGPIEAQAVLDSACGDAGTPWSDLVEAHTTEPLPSSVLCTLAARPGFPDALAEALPPSTLTRLADQGPATARAALKHHGRSLLARSHMSSFDMDHTIRRIRSAGVLTDEEVLATVRPASAALGHGAGLPLNRPDRGSWSAVCAELLERAAAEAGPGFWRELAERLRTFEGSLPELLASWPTDR